MKLFNSTSKQEKNISWEYSGKPNFAVGTGATMTEQILGWGSCFVVPIILIIAIASGKIQVEWSIQLLLIALFLAFEVGGGVVCNSLNSAKRFYHSPIKNEEGWKGKLLKNPLVFAFFHIHSILVWFLFKPEEFLIGILWYILLLSSAIIVHITPLYLKRPVAMLIITTGIMMNFYVLPSISGFEWLMPLLFLKIVYAHSVMEEPYRSQDNL